MESEIEAIEEIPVNQTKQPPSFWKWYFGWHPRLFLTVPTFLLFVYQGLWYIWAEIQDVILFFTSRPITWGAIFLVMILGTFLTWFILAPIYISFSSLVWLYEINTGKYSAWKKFLSTLGIILLVMFGTGLIRLFTAWILQIV